MKGGDDGRHAEPKIESPCDIDQDPEHGDHERFCGVLTQFLGNRGPYLVASFHNKFRIRKTFVENRQDLVTDAANSLGRVMLDLDDEFENVGSIVLDLLNLG